MKILLVLLVPLALLLQGCPKPIAMHLYNNTSKDFVVKFTDGTADWRAQTVLTLTDDELNRLNWLEKANDRANVPIFAIHAGASVSRYALGAAYTVPRDFVSNKNTTEIYLQLEENRSVYAVMPGSDQPAQIPKPQPSGFPIKATTTF